MYPKDNIFNIYYNIGKRVPFQVKRSHVGLKGWRDKDYRYSKEGKTFMVERVEPRGKYGEAYGYCLIDNVRNDEYMHEVYPDNKGEIPCAGCGEWVLVDVPGVDMDEVFPVHRADEVIPFGQYKGKTYAEIYKEDPKYIFWLLESEETESFILVKPFLSNSEKKAGFSEKNGSNSEKNDTKKNRVEKENTKPIIIRKPVIPAFCSFGCDYYQYSCSVTHRDCGKFLLSNL